MNTSTDTRPVPLSRNRNYQLLWVSQASAELGVNITTIAFPLLVLALTGSPSAASLVLVTMSAARLVVGLPAGALADRWNRKAVMVLCEAAQAVAAGSLVLALWWDVATVPHMVAVAAVIGVAAALFEPAEEATLPNLVPAEQLGTAVSINAARGYLAQLLGTAAGGFLFAVGRVVPFLVDLISHTVAFLGLLFLRIPKQERKSAPVGQLGSEIVTGVRWVWQQRPLRTMALCAVLLNLFFTAFYLVVIILAQTRNVPAGEIGVMASLLGVGGLLGALAAPLLHRLISPAVSIIGVFWVLTLLTPLTIWIDSGYLMGLLFAGMAFTLPAANTTISTYQLLLTPDELRGRLGGVMGVATGVAGTAGPALGGVLMELLPATTAVLVCTGGIALTALLVTLSPTLRNFPRPTVPVEEHGATTTEERAS
ncbi:MFS transporter [Crossiella sp. CA-258035]|uniref:MFS transporter n=1 Tax=Crossiella sp. CA-258035 TaxID=2981138 RepID=UPI0024BBF0B5|nr:MFS transporter [Crossiella sp. CA-258035]WHT21652.1 MFS transporter [Crossiella sp. CA-258035]